MSENYSSTSFLAAQHPKHNKLDVSRIWEKKTSDSYAKVSVPVNSTSLSQRFWQLQTPAWL